MMLQTFLSGAVTAGFAMGALFFLRFWRDTRDTLFLSFATAFLLLGIGQTTLALSAIPDEYRSWVYLLRLAAFLMIVAAVLRKNRR